MNKVILHGNLGADPELRVAQSGTNILKLRMATTERVKQGEEWVEKTEWHNVTVFGARAEGLSKILAKGDKILVEGRLQTSSYEKDGEKRYSTDVIAYDVFLSGGGKKSEGRQASAPKEDPFA